MVRMWIDDDGVIRLEARGRIEAGPLLAAHERFYEEHWDAFVAAGRHLADYRNADLSGIEGASVKKLASGNVEISRRRPPLRIAVLMDEGLGYGLARMWEQHAQATGWPLKVFTAEDEAWRWLDEDDDTPGDAP